MIHVNLALVFLTKLFLSSRFSAPKYIASHYGHQALMTLRKLEQNSRTIAKRRADIIFLKKCVLYNLIPKFLRFKLYKNSVKKYRRTQPYRKSLLLYKINQQKKEIKSLKGKLKISLLHYNKKLEN